MSSWVQKMADIKTVITTMAATPAAPMLGVMWEEEPELWGDPKVILALVSQTNTHEREVYEENEDGDYDVDVTGLVDFQLQVQVRSQSGSMSPNAHDIAWRILRRMRQPDVKSALKAADLVIENGQQQILRRQFEVDGHTYNAAIFELHMRTTYSLDEVSSEVVHTIERVEGEGEISPGGETIPLEVDREE